MYYEINENKYFELIAAQTELEEYETEWDLFLKQAQEEV